MATRTEKPEESWTETLLVLDQELERLPEKYRAVIVLCDLQGKTRSQAVHHLGCAEGTVASRLTRGRAMLAKRLAQHGLSVTAGALATMLSHKAAFACVPPSLVASTTRAASIYVSGKAVAGLLSAKVIALTDAALKVMLLGKLKTTLVVLIALSALMITCSMMANGRLGTGRQQSPFVASQPAHAAAAAFAESSRFVAKEIVANAPEPAKKGSTKPATDLYGDPLPPGALTRVGSVRLRHGDGVWSVAFAPDGRTLASGSGDFDPTIRFWDMVTGREVRRLQISNRIHGDGMMSVAFSPDGSKLAAGTSGSGSGGRGSIILWNARTGNHLITFFGHWRAVSSIAFSPDGKQLASASYDGSVRIWDVATARKIRDFVESQ